MSKDMVQSFDEEVIFEVGYTQEAYEMCWRNATYTLKAYEMVSVM